jgi:hypothetical protein
MRGGKPNPQPERDQKMVTMYRQGLTLEKIGQSFGLTRERVRQILVKNGIRREDGGQAKCARAKSAAHQLRKEADAIKRYGVTYEQARLASASGLMRAYVMQRNNAGKRGIAWNLNFAQWYDVWLVSGKLDQRGRGKGKYVMSRIKDAGGYEIGNVHIQLAVENSREAVAKWLGKRKQHKGVFCLYPGTDKPFVVKRVGRFETAELAAEARNEYLQRKAAQQAVGA